MKLYRVTACLTSEVGVSKADRGVWCGPGIYPESAGNGKFFIQTLTQTNWKRGRQEQRGCSS